MSKTHEHLIKLKEVTNEILEDLKENRALYRINDAVNWDDLSCTEATYVMNDAGDEYFNVIIEEADPNSYALCEFVRQELVERDYHLTYPICQW
jgi:hypothetical protein